MLETSESILSTLQALIEGTQHLPTNNRLGTFRMEQGALVSRIAKGRELQIGIKGGGWD